MSKMNLFPVRVPIGTYTDDDDVQHAVYASDEFYRALTALFRRVGGANGLDISDLEILASFAQQPAGEQAEALADAGTSSVFVPAPAVACCDVFDTEPSMAARVAELEKRLAETDLQLRVASNQLAMAAELMKRVEDIALDHRATALPMEFCELTKTVMALEIAAAFAPPLTDWEHPGPIGLKTPSTGAFTTISATSTIAAGGLVTSDVGFRRTASAASAGYMCSQLDGAAAVHGLYWDATNPCLVNAGTIRLKVTSAGTETTGTTKATGIATSDIGFRRSATAGTAGYIASQLDGAAAAHGLYWDGTNTNLVAAAGIIATIKTTGVDITGALKPTGAFGCNGKTAQTAYASGGALNAYGAGANGFDTAANASALHAMVVSIRAALVANGTMS